MFGEECESDTGDLASEESGNNQIPDHVPAAEIIGSLIVLHINMKLMI